MQVFQSVDEPEVIRLIKDGKVGVVPTDTVYGLVCAASDQKAVERLYALKRRESKPGTLIAADVEQLVDLGLKARYLKPVEHFWPGSVSVIIPTADLEYLRRGVAGLAVRVPADTAVRNFLMQTGPLQTTSANLPGEPTANTVQEAQTYFGDLPDFYVDGGDMSGRPPSTVIRIVDDAIEILRQGAVKIDETGRVLE